MNILTRSLIILCVIIVFGYLVIILFFGKAKIATNSMVPTINPGETVVYSRLHYAFGKPASGEIVLFKPHLSYSPQYVWVHRIVAEEGDKIEIKSGVLKVNGLETQFPNVSTMEEVELTVPFNSYYQKGDNIDSYHGLISKDYVLGKVLER